MKTFDYTISEDVPPGEVWVVQQGAPKVSFSGLSITVTRPIKILGKIVNISSPLPGKGL